MQYFFIGVYILLSVFGLVLFKLGSANGLLLNLSSSFFSLKIHWMSIIGFLFYILSFLIYMALIAKSNLSQLVPIVTGIVYLATLASAVLIFKETIHSLQIVGSILVLIGVVLMNINLK